MMWLKSLSINAVNLVKKSATIPKISNFSQGIIFYWRALYTPCKLTVLIVHPTRQHGPMPPVILPYLQYFGLFCADALPMNAKTRGQDHTDGRSRRSIKLGLLGVQWMYSVELCGAAFITSHECEKVGLLVGVIIPCYLLNSRYRRTCVSCV